MGNKIIPLLFPSIKDCGDFRYSVSPIQNGAPRVLPPVWRWHGTTVTCGSLVVKGQSKGISTLPTEPVQLVCPMLLKRFSASSVRSLNSSWVSSSVLLRQLLPLLPLDSPGVSHSSLHPILRFPPSPSWSLLWNECLQKAQDGQRLRWPLTTEDRAGVPLEDNWVCVLMKVTQPPKSHLVCLWERPEGHVLNVGNCERGLTQSHARGCEPGADARKCSGIWAAADTSTSTTSPVLWR